MAAKRAGRLEEAEAKLRRVAAYQEMALGPQHPKLALTLSGLAQALSEQGRLHQAEKMSDRAIAILTGSGHADDPQAMPVLTVAANPLENCSS